MHERTHGEGGGIPVSSGIPSFVRILATIGLVVIFIMGGLVIGTSWAGHVWPSQDSLKIPLPTTLKIP